MDTKRINIDASSLQYTHCFRRFYNKIVLGYETTSRPVNDIEYGSAFHIFRDTLAKTKNPFEACSAGSGYFAARRNEGMIFKDSCEWLNEDHLTRMMLRYISEFPDFTKSWGKYKYLQAPDKPDGEQLTEQTFSIPFLEFTGIEFFLQGTIDGLLDGRPCVLLEDDKTTKQWNIKKFLNDFELKPQLKFYRLALELLSKQEGGEWFESLFTSRVGAKINGVFLKTEVDKCVFEQSRIFFFEQWEIDELRGMLEALCARVYTTIIDGVIPQREGVFNSTCEGKFNQSCDFCGPCSAKEELYEKLLESHYTKRIYEPLNFRKLD
jgi:hypothetical protein